MFKTLKEKFTSWFKKSKTEEETKETDKPKKSEKEEKKQKPAKPKSKQAKEKQPKEKKPVKEKPSKKSKEKEIPEEEIPQEEIEKPSETEKEESSEAQEEETSPKELTQLIKEKTKKPEQQIEEQTEKQQAEQIQEKQPEEKPGFIKKFFSRKKETPLKETPSPQETESLQKPQKSIEEQETQSLQEQIKEFEEEAEAPKKQAETFQIKIETLQQIEEKEIKEEKPSFFTKLRQKLSTKTLSQEEFDSLFPEFEITLLENNVALEVVDKIREELSKDLVGIEVKKSDVESTIINSLKDAILSVLQEPPNLIEQINKSLEAPYTIIFVGINGSGKTTTIAKFAHYLKQHKISCCLAAADTFRAASIEQLEKHAEALQVPIIKHNYGADPAAVAFDAKKYAKAHNIKVVLIDTAGRMYTKTNLIKEMEKIVRVSKPDLKLFIGESITGNDATAQAKTFNEAIDIDGIILSKADVDEKAGTILSVSYITKKPIYFLGTGQSYDTLQPFTKEAVLKNLGLE